MSIAGLGTVLAGSGASLATFALGLVLGNRRRKHRKPGNEPRETDGRFHGQFRQDEYVYERFFRDQADGVFVEIGASDGLEASNCYFFEKELGWHGVCIEPQAGDYAALVRNRNCICIRGCAASQEGEQEFLQLEGYKGCCGLVNEYDPRHRSFIDEQIERGRTKGEKVKVPCYHLPKLLREHGIHQVDFLSIDTEGSELTIIRSIDFSKLPVRVIAVELLFPLPEMRHYLESYGFEYVERIGLDEIYCNPHFKQRAPTLA